MNEMLRSVTRRRALKILALLGASGPVATLWAQARKRVTPQVLQSASAIISHDLAPERLEVAATALQRNLDEFQLVRDLEIDDLVEPVLVFNAKWS